MKQPNRSRLSSFFASRFHNMWPEMYGTWEEVINDYAKRKKTETLETIRKELKEIIEQEHDEGTLRRIVTKDLGANFYAPGDGLTYQLWLEKVYALLGEWVKNIPSNK